MEATEYKGGDDLLEQLNFDNLGPIDLDNLFDPAALATDLSSSSSFSPENFPTSSPDSVSMWIGHVENILMNDDDYLVASAEPSDQFSLDFLADILVDTPPSEGRLSTDYDSGVSSHKGLGGASETEKESEKVVAAVVDVSSDDGDVGASETEKEAEKVVAAVSVDDDEDKAKVAGNEDPDDHLSKKQRRQLRNRDAAVRSRERKKMYVRDLEMKSRYLEGECRRLERLLQCFIAENQALRLGLQKGNAYGVTSAKQESAVLLLESLLLGSLLWFLGIMCLFTLPLSNLGAVPLVNVEKKVERKVLGRGVGSKMLANMVIQSFVNGRRCKASRTRMKLGSMFIEVLV